MQELPAAECHKIQEPYTINNLSAIRLLPNAQGSLQIRVNGSVIYYLPLNILSLTGKKEDSLITFDINAFLLADDFIGQDVSVELSPRQPFSIQLLPISSDQSVKSKSTENVLPQISSYTCYNTSTELISSSPFFGLTKGFLVEVADSSAFRCIKLLSNITEDAITSDLTQLFHMSPQHVWIPINPINAPSPFIPTMESFMGGVELDDKHRIYLEFTEPQEKVTIYNFYQANNILRRHSY